MDIQKQLIVLSALLGLGGHAFAADPQQGQAPNPAQQQQQLTPEQLAAVQHALMQGRQHTPTLFSKAFSANPFAKVDFGLLLIRQGNAPLGELFYREGLELHWQFGCLYYDAQKYSHALRHFEERAQRIQNAENYYNCGRSAYCLARNFTQNQDKQALLQKARSYLHEAAKRGFQGAFGAIGQMIYEGHYQELVESEADRWDCFRYLQAHADAAGIDIYEVLAKVFPAKNEVALKTQELEVSVATTTQGTAQNAVAAAAELSWADINCLGWEDWQAKDEETGPDDTAQNETAQQNKADVYQEDEVATGPCVQVQVRTLNVQPKDDSSGAPENVDDAAAENQESQIGSTESQEVAFSSAQNASSTASESSSSSSSNILVPTDESLYEDALRELALADDENDAHAKHNLQRSAYKKLSQSAAMDYMPALRKLALIIFSESPKEFCEVLAEDQDSDTIYKMIEEDFSNAAETNELHPTVASILALYLGAKDKLRKKLTKLKELGITIPQKRLAYLRGAAQDDKLYFGRVAYEFSRAITNQQEREKWLERAAQANCKEALVELAEQLCKAEDYERGLAYYEEAGAKPSSEICIGLAKAYSEKKLKNGFIKQYDHVILKGMESLAKNDYTVCRVLAELYKMPDSVLVQEKSSQEAIKWCKTALRNLPKKPPNSKRRGKGKKGRGNKQPSYAEKQKALAQERSELVYELASLHQAEGDFKSAKEALVQFLLEFDEENVSRKLFELWVSCISQGADEIFTHAQVLKYLLGAKFKKLEDGIYGVIYDHLNDVITSPQIKVAIHKLFCPVALVNEVKGLFLRKLIFSDPSQINPENQEEVARVKEKITDTCLNVATFLAAEDQDKEGYLLVAALGDDPLSCVELGRLLSNEKNDERLARAEWCFRRALELKYTPAHLFLGKFLHIKKKYERAVPHLLMASMASVEKNCAREAAKLLIEITVKFVLGEVKGKSGEDARKIQFELHENNPSVTNSIALESAYDAALSELGSENFAKALELLDAGLENYHQFDDLEDALCEDALCLAAFLQAKQHKGVTFDVVRAFRLYQKAIDDYDSTKAKYNHAILELVGVDGHESSSVRASTFLDLILSDGYKPDETDLRPLQLYKDCGKRAWKEFGALLGDLVTKQLQQLEAQRIVAAILKTELDILKREQASAMEAARTAHSSSAGNFKVFMKQAQAIKKQLDALNSLDKRLQKMLKPVGECVELKILNKRKVAWAEEHIAQIKSCGLERWKTMTLALVLTCTYFAPAIKHGLNRYELLLEFLLDERSQLDETEWFAEACTHQNLNAEEFSEVFRNDLRSNKALYGSYLREVWDFASGPQSNLRSRARGIADGSNYTTKVKQQASILAPQICKASKNTINLDEATLLLELIGGLVGQHRAESQTGTSFKKTILHEALGKFKQLKQGTSLSKKKLKSSKKLLNNYIDDCVQEIKKIFQDSAAVTTSNNMDMIRQSAFVSQVLEATKELRDGLTEDEIRIQVQMFALLAASQPQDDAKILIDELFSDHKWVQFLKTNQEVRAILERLAEAVRAQVDLEGLVLSMTS